MSTVIPRISTLSSRVIRILGCNPGNMTLQGTNTYLIGTGSKRILIDSGESGQSEYLSNLKKLLTEKNVSLSDIVITHWHHDHIGGVDGILRSFPQSECKVWKYPLEDDKENSIKFSYLNDGDELSTEGATLRFYYTPGHTEDHLIGVLLEENTLFSGDCILGEGTTVFENLRKYMESLKVILELNPVKILPGHGPEILNPVDKIREYIDHRMKREEAILACLPTKSMDALSASDIVKLIYTDVPEILHAAAAVNVTHHLSKLVEEAKIEELGNTKKYYLSSTSS